MKVRILESARNDLVDGFYFYEKQAEGIGSYFLESIYSEIDSLTDNAGIRREPAWIRSKVEPPAADSEESQ